VSSFWGLDAVLGFHVGYQAEPGSYSLQSLAKGSVVVVPFAVELYLELRATFDERAGPVYANMARVTLCAHGIGCEPVEDPRAISSNNMPKNHDLCWKGCSTSAERK
jgi:hypothetical protein